MNCEEFFKQYKTKTITADNIKEAFQLHNQTELKTLIEKLISEKLILPIGKEMTYQSPQVHKKYRIIRENNLELLQEMKYQYHVILNIDYYKKHIEDYEKDKPAILQLSNYLKSGKLKKCDMMSINERSMDIFGNEKFMASKDGQTLFTRLKLTMETFRIYRTPEPFFYYYNPDIPSKQVLIIENKDTWYTMRQLLRENRNICGMSFCAVIYGEGRKIQNSFRDIDFEEYKPLNDSDHTFYYFGDIDSYGIDILCKLIEDNPGYSMIPFLKGYQFLLAKEGKRRKKTEADKITLGKEKVDRIFSGLTDQERETLYSVCTKGEILPQELLNNEILRGEYFSCHHI